MSCVSGLPRIGLGGTGVDQRFCRVINLADVVSPWRNGSVVQGPEDLDRTDSSGVHAVTVRKHSSKRVLRHECRNSMHATKHCALVNGDQSAQDE